MKNAGPLALAALAGAALVKIAEHAIPMVKARLAKPAEPTTPTSGQDDNDDEPKTAARVVSIKRD